jgi:ABC-type Fe3+/spermidine/putrescine transport system ATPase subunit
VAADALPGRASFLQLRDVAKTLGGRAILDGVSLDVGEGDLLGLLGPSGSGKTTLLNIIGGFTDPDGGSVSIAGQDLTNLPPYRRDIGITFQKYALFPHLSVFDNIAFGLRQRRIGKTGLDQRVRTILPVLGLTGLEGRMPRSLSGGEQQRVALARALVVRPRLMLLDEPLANLDAALRQRVRFEIREILRSTGVTSIFVTHDQDEAFALCDRVAVLRSGRIQQIGTPAELIAFPENAFVAGFIGSPNVFRATVQRYDAGRRCIRFDSDGFSGEAGARTKLAQGTPVDIFVRPDEVVLAPGDPGSGFRIKDWIHLGSGREAWIEGPIKLRARLPSEAMELERGAPVTPSWRIDRAHAFAVQPPPVGGA